MRHAGWNVRAGAGHRRHPVAVDVEIHNALEDVEGPGMRTVQMQTERELALEIVFHQRVGAASIGGRDLDVGVIARPVVVRAAAGRHEAIAFGRHRGLQCCGDRAARPVAHWSATIISRSCRDFSGPVYRSCDPRMRRLSRPAPAVSPLAAFAQRRTASVWSAAAEPANAAAASRASPAAANLTSVARPAASARPAVAPSP